MAKLFRLLYNKWFPPPLPPADTFKDQTILITGATGGLGLEAAIHYVNLGASTVIITARTLSRGFAAQTTIEARTGKTGIIQVRELDMSTFDGVKKFVDSLKEDVKTIDVVLLNAGVWKRTYHVSPDNWEETMQVNTLSTISLGLLLLPWMKSCGSQVGRQHLGFVSSGLHATAEIETEDFPREDVLRYWSEEKNFLMPRAYALSKLFMMYGAAEIVKLAQWENESHSIIVNTMCPGLCKSDLGRDYAMDSYLTSIGVSFFFATMGKSAEAGARTFILGAMTGPEENGRYIKHYGSTNAGYQFELAENITSEAGHKLQRQVWEEMLQVFDAVIPEASTIVKSRV